MDELDHLNPQERDRAIELKYLYDAMDRELAAHDYLFRPCRDCAACRELLALHRLVSAAKNAADEDPPAGSKSETHAVAMLLWSWGVRAPARSQRCASDPFPF